MEPLYEFLLHHLVFAYETLSSATSSDETSGLRPHSIRPTRSHWATEDLIVEETFRFLGHIHRTKEQENVRCNHGLSNERSSRLYLHSNYKVVSSAFIVKELIQTSAIHSTI